MKLTIIGAGPVGAQLAWENAKKGREVVLVEEHNTIGAPVQCTGILTNDILKFVPKKLLSEHTKHIVTQTIVHGPHKKVAFEISPNYIIDNITYCQAVAAKAQDAGATIKLNTRYVDNTKNNITLKNVQTKKERNTTTNYLIGADGPTSSVAKQNGLYNKRKFLTGVQAIVKMKEYEEHIEFYPHIGEYAWYCPEGDGRARIGVAAQGKAKKIFDDFIKRYKGKIECMQGGPIPLYTPKPKVEKKYEKMNIQLIGDAVPFIKNTTGGGIIPGAKAARIHAKNPATYAKNLAPLKKELGTHYLINKTLRKFTDKDWDKLLTQVDNEAIKKLLKKTNRDNAVSLATQLLIKKPALALWARKIV